MQNPVLETIKGCTVQVLFMFVFVPFYVFVTIFYNSSARFCWTTASLFQFCCIELELTSVCLLLLYLVFSVLLVQGGFG